MVPLCSLTIRAKSISSESILNQFYTLDAKADEKLHYRKPDEYSAVPDSV